MAGGVGGDNLQAGGDITIHQAPAPAEALTYQVKWHWASPVTQAALGWAGLALGILSVLGGMQTVRPLIDALATEVAPVAAPQTSTWTIVFIVGISATLITLALRRIAKHETHHLTWPGLPTLTGWGHRLGFARFVGRCHCGARLRFYSKPRQWHVNSDGSRGRVIERRGAAECEANDEHYGWIDKTERPA